MCLILLAWRAHPDYRLVVAANRDEYFARPTAAAAFWDDQPQLLAGRDLEARGTWLGVTRQGRFAALTNYRNPAEVKPVAPSRGRLVSGFLAGSAAARDYLDGIAREADKYNGFSMLAGDGAALHFFSNRGDGPAEVSPGVHGLSNHLLDTPWPKVEKGKARFAALLEKGFDADAMLTLLDDTETAANGLLPSTGVGLEMEERLSAMRIAAHEGYGTRCSTVLCLRENGEAEFAERSFNESGEAGATARFRFTLPAAKARASS